MKLTILAVGKIKKRYFTDAIAEYAKRLGRYVDFAVVESAELPPKSGSAADISLSLNAEGKKLLEHIRGYTVALAIDGVQLSSPELARLIDAKATEGVSEITFVIGGSNGLSAEVLARADKKISFGKATYPHQLMRVVLAEQLYRAVAINNNLPYHK